MNNKSIEHTAVVVLNYKRPSDTVDCVESLINQSVSDFMIVLIENGSKDDSISVFKELHKKHPARIVVLYNDTNRGFAGGVNTGIKWAQDNHYDYVALFNNDATADKKWLESLLVRTRNDNTIGIVTSLLLHSDGKTIDSTGEQYSIWGLTFPRYRDKPTSMAPESGFVFGATGGASLYRISLFDEIGLFDETFFAYYEDVDVSFRAQLHGWKVYYEPSAIAFHAQGATSSTMPGFGVYQTFKNLPLVYIKNVPTSLLLPIGVRLFFAYIMILGHAIKRGDTKPALKGYFQGILLFWLHGVPARFTIQSRKKVTTSYIYQLLWRDLPPEQSGLRKVRKIFTGK